jgi:ADP-ribosylglycohydrolase
VLDACRLYAAMLAGALLGAKATPWLAGVPDLEPSPWTARPLRKDVQAAAEEQGVEPAPAPGSAVHAVLEARRIVREATAFEAAIDAAMRVGRSEAPVYAALAGTLFGARHGIDAVPASVRDRLLGRAQVEELLGRLIDRGQAAGVIA